MESVSVPTLVSGLIDCMSQLIRVAEELLQFLSQEQQALSAQQNGSAEEGGACASPSDEDSLPDLAEFSDLESILSVKEDDDLVVDMDEAMIDANDANEGIPPAIQDESESEKGQ
ncbi:putative uncharacterized protein TRPC5OS [Nannospalax galili]|uniref:putative uncharacterized protein TRPC5OS n=1 Tax=Nannospalax galili TaxID=1026970 RepID=UPI0004ED6182|nr:putative uncharacterized protein TRPC5OS [Nannospalax galili]